jgi:hypothetical protein
MANTFKTFKFRQKSLILAYRTGFERLVGIEIDYLQMRAEPNDFAPNFRFIAGNNSHRQNQNHQTENNAKKGNVYDPVRKVFPIFFRGKNPPGYVKVNIQLFTIFFIYY